MESLSSLCSQQQKNLKLNFIKNHLKQYYFDEIQFNKFKNFVNEVNPSVNEAWDEHIPMVYKCNSRENRLKLLAGLLDSDGYLCHDKCTFEFSQKSEKLIDDVIYLCRSLGFACYKYKEKNLNLCVLYIIIIINYITNLSP